MKSGANNSCPFLGSEGGERLKPIETEILATRVSLEFGRVGMTFLGKIIDAKIVRVEGPFVEVVILQTKETGG
jgi:hypothetical protein